MEKTQKISLVTRAVYEGILKKIENEVVVSDTWTQVTTPTARTPFKNAIYNSIMSEEGALQRIEEVIAHKVAVYLFAGWYPLIQNQKT